jgi:hypothetical protein
MKIRNELVEELDTVDTDRKAVNIGNHINDITITIQHINRLAERTYEYIDHDLFMYLFKNNPYSMLGKKIKQTNNGFEIIDICLNNFSQNNILICKILNTDFQMNCYNVLGELDGTLSNSID